MKSLLGLLLIVSLFAGCAAPLKPAADAPATLYLPRPNLVTAGHGDDCDWEFPAGPYHLLGENDLGLYYKPEKPMKMPNPNQGVVARTIQGDRIPVWNMGVAVRRSDFHDDYAIASRIWSIALLSGLRPGRPVELKGKIFLTRSPDGMRRSDWWRE